MLAAPVELVRHDGEVAGDHEVARAGARVDHEVGGCVVRQDGRHRAEPEHAHAVGAEVGHEQPVPGGVDHRLVRVR